MRRLNVAQSKRPAVERAGEGAGIAATPSLPAQLDSPETSAQEDERFQKALEELKSKQPEAASDGQAKVTINDIEYEFISIHRNGKLATMKLGLTAKKGDPRLLWQMKIRLIGANSEEYLTPYGTAGGKGDQSGIRLLEGIRREVVFDLGALPSSMNEISTIIIPAANSGGGPHKARANPVILRGNFKVE